MSEKWLSEIFSGGNSDLQAAVNKVKAAIAAGKAEYIQLHDREHALTMERDSLPKKRMPYEALCDEITQHALAAIDEASDKLGDIIAQHIIRFATRHTLNLRDGSEGTPITYAQFDDAKANSRSIASGPHLLPRVIAEPFPLDPLILAAVLLGKLKEKTPADALVDVIKCLPEQKFGFDRISQANIGTDRITLVKRLAEIDVELESIKQRREELHNELQALGVNTSKAGWMHEKDAQ